MRADIHGGPEQKLQSEAGYIDARPQTDSSTKTSCNARPDHTFGVKLRRTQYEHMFSALTSKADIIRLLDLQQNYDPRHVPLAALELVLVQPSTKELVPKPRFSAHVGCRFDQARSPSGN